MPRTTATIPLRPLACVATWARIGLLGLLCLVSAPTFAQAGRRVALVVGNAAYGDTPLRNPANDAEDLAAKLRTLGFEVTALTNRNRSQLTAAIRDFGRSAAGADAALFYFAGHGVQVRGHNYLLPVGQTFSEEAEVETDAVDVNSVLARMEEAGARVSLLILDACRTNPLQRAGRGSARGLARMEAPSGALVAFAAQPGAEAQDGDGRNGVFTKHLLEHIGTPGLPVEQMFKRVRADVERETARRQSPRDESSLTADFYFANPFGPVSAQSQASLEDEAWALCKASTTEGPCQDYLSAWPKGRYLALARTKLRELEALQTRPAAQPDPGSRPVAAGLGTGDRFRDCPDCPEMVVVGAGSFVMGSPAGEVGRFDNEGPQRTVTIGRAFGLGRTEVTVGEFKRFVEASHYVTDAERNLSAQGCYTWEDSKWDWRAGRSWRSPGFEQSDAHPVVCVSWNDALAYIGWLNRQTGRTYRLPSEAEWEYAARAGSSTSRPWGDDASQACRYANVADQTKGPGGQSWDLKLECNDGYWYTAPVGHYEANRFGLNDMIGNAWEWVQDCYDDKAYGGKAPSDGSAYEVAGCSLRSLRGGSWDGIPRNARSAYRNRNSPDFRSNDTGFRLARIVP